jgi:small subunit ribosomal protein S17
MPKRILEGVVVSDKGDKTIVVRVERTLLHPVLKKTVRRSKRYHAHDEANAYKTGELARIIECAPKSKLKTWEALPKAEAEEAAKPKKATRAKKPAPAAAEASAEGAAA